jgi:DNA-binding transcriptional LysR family regulator
VSNLPDFEGLAIFAKVVQMRSFVGAAEELRLSKATLSKAVSRLEKKFGTRLFNRTARRLAVTEAGRQLYDRAAHILLEGEAAESEGVPIGSRCYRLVSRVPALGRYRRKWPILLKKSVNNSR